MAAIKNRHFEHRAAAPTLQPNGFAAKEHGTMRFGLFGSAAARRPNPSEAAEFDSSEGFRDFIEYNVEAEGLGFHGTFVVEHHFTGYGQVSATINLLTWLSARTSTLRLEHPPRALPPPKRGLGA